MSSLLLNDREKDRRVKSCDRNKGSASSGLRCRDGRSLRDYQTSSADFFGEISGVFSTKGINSFLRGRLMRLWDRNAEMYQRDQGKAQGDPVDDKRQSRVLLITQVAQQPADHDVGEDARDGGGEDVRAGDLA